MQVDEKIRNVEYFVALCLFNFNLLILIIQTILADFFFVFEIVAIYK